MMRTIMDQSRCRQEPCCPGNDRQFMSIDRPTNCGCQRDTERNTNCACQRDTERNTNCGCQRDTDRSTNCGCQRETERSTNCACQRETERNTNCGCQRETERNTNCGCQRDTERNTNCPCQRDTERNTNCPCQRDTDRNTNCACQRDADRSTEHSTECRNDRSLAMVYAENQCLNDIYDPCQALSHGTLFPALDKPMCDDHNCIDQACASECQKANFALWEMRLYLDTHPCDSKALALFNRLMSSECCQAGYAAALLPGAGSMSRWNWTDDPWPWDYQCCEREG